MYAIAKVYTRQIVTKIILIQKLFQFQSANANTHQSTDGIIASSQSSPSNAQGRQFRKFINRSCWIIMFANSKPQVSLGQGFFFLTPNTSTLLYIAILLLNSTLNNTILNARAQARSRKWLSIAHLSHEICKRRPQTIDSTTTWVISSCKSSRLPTCKQISTCRHPLFNDFSKI